MLRVPGAGKFVSNFANLDVERLARNDVDDVAMIHRQNKSIAFADRDGKIIARIPAKGTNYQFADPADVDFAHSVALRAGQQQGRDPRLRAKNTLITTIAVPGREPGALQKPKALAIDAAGRLYVFNESTQRIQVYR